MSERSSIFDMIGPVMIGPSSSHTGGVARIGRVARHIFGEEPEHVTITFYNSFARTFEGHGSDRAILAGLMDMKPDDQRIKQALDIAKKRKLSFHFKAVQNASALHPNSIRIIMEKGNKKEEVLGVSKGGGLIAIREINGFTCNFSASSPTLIIRADDVDGSIAFITSVVAHENCNIATMTVNRKGKRDLAKQVLELDHPIRPLTVEYLKSLDWIKEVIYLDPIVG
ncbi:L-serine ammonia-lyase, iron-sulfur-dependent subunit beta [Pontibacter sp. G13]|uniref:L-serine ammonia-lyase, iron-sulfur-dependent subunit beta n=1 Tax=Pontibacter sp. G13 TaxID=3074898 RepID=UPI00288979CC|nr:L-serine ammonia-lyase, iron-sulfur-dependent subunit beta [Pontibacter sp. G13]WNJ21287.1 L-serine ammonia-lyase, iron-sulfur-dependent subunit beta [Pontibacter sp. G13]